MDKIGCCFGDELVSNNQENSNGLANGALSNSDENSRMYATLLQNQVLGIQNPHLIQGGFLNDDYMDS